MRRSIKLQLFPALVFLLIILQVIGNYRWIKADHSIPHHDENQYFCKSIACWRIISRPGPDKLSRLLNAEPRIRPHLFPLTAGPFYLIGGESYDSARLSNSLFLILLLIAVYQTGKLLSGAATGFWAVFILSCYPFVTRFSRLYWSEICLMAFFAGGMYLLLKADSFRNRKYSFFLGIIIGLGMAAKQQFFFVMFFPVLWEGIRAWFSRIEPGESSPKTNFALCLLLGAVITLPYYFFFSRTFSTKLIYAFSGGAWEPVKSVFSFASLFWYLGRLQIQVSLFFFILFIPFLILLGLQGGRRARLIVLTFLGDYLIFSFFPSKDARYISTLLPLIALITAVGITRSKSKALKISLPALMVVIGSFNYLQVSWQRGPFNIPYHKSRLKLPFSKPELRLLPVAYPPARPADWKIKEISRAIRENMKGKKALVLVVPYLPEFGVNSFQYLALLKDIPLKFVTVGTKRLYNYNYKYLLQADFVVTKTGPVVPFHHLRFEWEEKTGDLFNSPSPHLKESLRLIASYPLPDGTEARLYRRVREAGPAEKIEVIRSALEIDPKNPWAWLGLGEAYLTQKEFTEALRAFNRVVELIPKWTGGYLNRGIVYLARGETKKALSQIKRSLEITPRWPYAHYVLGMAYQQQGKIPEAIKEYKTARAKGKYDLPKKARAKLKALGVGSGD